MKYSIYNLFGILVFGALLLLTGCKDDLLVGPAVTVSGVSPSTAFAGEAVTLTGENLHTVRNVFVADRHAEIQSASEGSLTFLIPVTVDPGVQNVTLAMLDGYRRTTSVEVMLRPVPSIASISPSAANIGEQVTIRGLNLAELSTAKIGGVDAEIVAASNQELVLTVPSGLPVNTTAVIELATSEAVATSTSIFFVGPNLIANSDLEAGSGDEFTSWEKLNGGDQMTEVTGADAYYGRSMRIVGAAANPWSTQLASQEMQLNLNSEYTVLFWAKAEAEGAIMRVSSSQYNHHGSGSDFFYGDDQAIPTEWTQMSWTFTVTADLPSYKLVLDMGTTDVPFLIDNVTLIETGAAGPPVPENLIVNSGFEDGLNGWELLNGAIEVSTESVHCGNQAIKVTGAGANPWSTQLASTAMPLVLDGTYEVSLWARAVEEGAVMRVSASRYNGGNGDDYFYGDDIALTTEWAAYKWTFTVGKDIPDGHHLVLDMGASDKVFYVDDVSVEEYLPPVNLLPNSDFEDGLASWELLNGTVEPTTNAAEVFSGNTAIKIVGAGGNPWDTQLAADVIPLTYGARYGVKLMAKAAGPDAVMRISASRYNGGNGDDYFYGDDVTLTEEWAEYSWEFVVGKDIPDGHHIVLDMGASSQTFFIDEVVVYEIPDFQCP